jgi:hypothetical protein
LEHASVSGILGTSASNIRALDLLKVACWSGNLYGIDLAGYDSRYRSARLDHYQFDIKPFGVEKADEAAAIQIGAIAPTGET